MYFSTLSLHLGIFPKYARYRDIFLSYCWESNEDESVEWREGLINWHNKRSRDILVTIMESDFGDRVKKLRIDAGPVGQKDTLTSAVSFVFKIG